MDKEGVCVSVAIEGCLKLRNFAVVSDLADEGWRLELVSDSSKVTDTLNGKGRWGTSSVI